MKSSRYGQQWVESDELDQTGENERKSTEKRLIRKCLIKEDLNEDYKQAKKILSSNYCPR